MLNNAFSYTGFFLFNVNYDTGGKENMVKLFKLALGTSLLGITIVLNQQNVQAKTVYYNSSNVVLTAKEKNKVWFTGTTGDMYNQKGKNSKFTLSTASHLKNWRNIRFKITKAAMFRTGKAKPVKYAYVVQQNYDATSKTFSKAGKSGWVKYSSIAAKPVVKSNTYVVPANGMDKTANYAPFTVVKPTNFVTLNNSISAVPVTPVTVKNGLSSNAVGLEKTLWRERTMVVTGSDGVDRTYYYVHSDNDSIKGWMLSDGLKAGESFTKTVLTNVQPNAWQGTNVATNPAWSAIKQTSNAWGTLTATGAKYTTTNGVSATTVLSSVPANSLNMTANFKTFSFLPLGNKNINVSGSSIKLSGAQQVVALNGALYVLYSNGVAGNGEESGTLMKISAGLVQKMKNNMGLISGIMYNKPKFKYYLHTGDIQFATIPSMGHGGAFTTNGSTLYLVQNHVGTDNTKGRFYQIDPGTLQVHDLNDFTITTQFGSQAPVNQGIPDNIAFVNATDFYMVSKTASGFIFYKGTMTAGGVKITQLPARLTKLIPGMADLQGLSYRKANNSLYLTMNQVIVKINQDDLNAWVAATDMNAQLKYSYTQLNAGYEIENVAFDNASDNVFLLKNSATEIMSGAVN